MSSVINTTFEVSLRVLLTLEAADGLWRTSDMIAAADFITVYGKEFCIADENLHGENSYKFSEFALRREIVKEAIKALVLDGLVRVKTAKTGFLYTLSPKGINYCKKLSSEYSAMYRAVAQKAYQHVKAKSDRIVLGEINRLSLYALHRGELNG